MNVNFEEKNKYYVQLGCLTYGDFFIWEDSLFLVVDVKDFNIALCFNFRNEMFREINTKLEVEPVISSELEIIVRR